MTRTCVSEMRKERNAVIFVCDFLATRSSNVDDRVVLERRNGRTSGNYFRSFEDN